MYLVLKDNVKKQIPIKAFMHYEDAEEFMDRYVRESSWHYTSYIAEHAYRKKGHPEAKRYYRDLKNHCREYIFIKYMRLHY